MADASHQVHVSVRQLRNETAHVMASVQSGVPVVLTVHGKPVANITPYATRSEQRTTEQVMADLEEIRQFSRRFGIETRPEDYDTGYTTDDL